jgi:tetratricopeptide (TPR) repeat protein
MYLMKQTPKFEHLFKNSEMSKYFIFILVLGLNFFVCAQSTDEQLANYYYSQGDCEKAIPYFQKIYAAQPSKFVFTRYLDCLQKEGDEKEIVDLVKKQMRNFPREFEYPVQMIQIYEQLGKPKDAEKLARKLIDDLGPIQRDIVNLQQAFSKVGKYDLALEVLQKGRKMLKDSYPLNIQFAEVYGELDRVPEMIEEYLGLLDYSAGMMNSLQRLMPRMIDFENENSEAYELLKNALIRRIQKDPSNAVNSEMLIWALIQRKDFKTALVQAKALDKRTTKDGKEVFNLGKTAATNLDYPTARKAFKYVVELGTSSPYYFPAEQALLNTRFLEVTTFRNYSPADIEETILEYETALTRIGRKGKSLPIIRELSYILAFYAGQPEKARVLLEEALKLPASSDMAQAEVKLLLGDVFVILGDIWEASLLYMQVENDFKFEPIGFEAKFKNAKVFYYAGDFKWSQSQLNILKESTTKLIANDAMQLSIFITDNLGLDSNLRAMRKFAQADLLIAQRKFDSAFLVLDSLVSLFPFHSLADDILLRRAQAFEEQGKWLEAIQEYQKILENHPQSIYADDALFNLAIIHDKRLLNPEKAAAYYFQLMKEFRGSVFVTEARKRYRELQKVS